MKKIIYAVVLSTFIYTSGYYVWVGSSPIQFKDESYQSGVASEGVNSSGPAFIDYDNDGDIDIYVVLNIMVKDKEMVLRIKEIVFY